MPENIAKVQQRIQYTFSGCKCKKGCGTRRCKCIKEGKKCGPGCRCLLCTNVNRVKVPELPQELRALEAEMTMTDNENELVEDSDDDLSEIDVDSETEQIIQSVFGSDSEAED